MKKITIKGVPVIEIYESFNGSYWFVTEKAWTQDSVISGTVYENDQILFGYVRLSNCPECAEWGYFSESELKALGPRVWKVHRQDWAACPEVEVEEVPDGRGRRVAEGRDGAGPRRSPSCSNRCKEVDEKMSEEIKDYQIVIQMSVADFKMAMGRRPIDQVEFDTWARLLRDKLVKDHIDWDVVYACTRDALRRNKSAP